jgi:hypothetical protein
MLSLDALEKGKAAKASVTSTAMTMEKPRR